jgi:hypothetical protein
MIDPLTPTLSRPRERGSVVSLHDVYLNGDKS